MQFLPIFLDLRSKPVLVVGGGEVAARKVALLRQAQAAVRLVAPRLCASLREATEAGEIEHLARGYQAGDLEGCHLAIAATDDAEINRTVSEHAKALRLPVNVVDQPELCSFIVPSIIDRSPVVAAVSTGGASPVLARLIRARLESHIPTAYGRLAELAERFRERVKSKITDHDQRRRFWEKVLSGGVAERVFAGRIEEADAALERELAETADGPPKGEVYLVGGGPGDPDLLSFRALRLMQQADVVVYDRLVAKSVLDLTRKDAERTRIEALGLMA